MTKLFFIFVLVILIFIMFFAIVLLLLLHSESEVVLPQGVISNALLLHLFVLLPSSSNSAYFISFGPLGTGNDLRVLI